MARYALRVAGIGLCLAAAACGSTSSSPKDPAIGMAREIGRALPIAQYDAFADGVINFEEVQTAADRLWACAVEGGVTSFAASVTEDGFESSHNGAEGDAVVIERCKIEHFSATFDVFQMQRLASP